MHNEWHWTEYTSHFRRPQQFLFLLGLPFSMFINDPPSVRDSELRNRVTSQRKTLAIFPTHFGDMQYYTGPEIEREKEIKRYIYIITQSCVLPDVR